MLATETLEQGVKYVQKLTIKIAERRHWRRYGIFIVDFEHISHLVPVFLFLKLVSAIFFKKIIFHQMIALQKL